MAKKTKTRDLVIYTIVFAGAVLCALACGCTATPENTLSDNETYATAAPGAMAPPEPGNGMTNGTMQAPPGNGTMQGPPGGEDRGMPDLATAAATLGVTVEELRSALGTQPGGAPGTPPDGQAPPAS